MTQKKKIISAATGSLLAILLIIWLVGYMTTGKVSITTSNPYATITLTRAGDTSFSKTAHNKLALSLHKGDYTVLVQGTSVGASQAVHVKPHNTLNLKLDPAKASGVEPVADLSADNIAADNSRLYYIDRLSRGLYQIDSQDNVSSVDASHQFQSIKWYSGLAGVGQDQSGNLYSINNGVVKKLELPAPSSGVYDVAPNGQLYFSYKFDIYKGAIGGVYSKIYTPKDPFSSLAASVNSVAIISSPQAENPSSKPYVSFVSNSGQVSTKNITASATSVWSADGQHLASGGSQNYQILDTSLKPVVNIPNTSIGAMAWLDNNTLVYIVSDQLWSFNLASMRSNLLANMPLGAQISSISISGDHSYVYLALAGDSNSSGSIKRVGLKGQKVDSLIYGLQSVLPSSQGGFSLTLVDFSSPVVYVRSNGDSPSLIYLKAAQTQLQQEGFGAVPIRVSP